MRAHAYNTTVSNLTGMGASGYDSAMATASTTNTSSTTSATGRPELAPATRMGFEALVAILHIQATVIRPIDDALERAHRANLTGYEVLSRLAALPDGASVRSLSEQVVVSPSRVSRMIDE